MIFSLYSRVKVKLEDGEEHIFDRSRLMYTEVAEIEKVTGLSYPEWEQQLAKLSITALAALLHVLRKREGTASDFATMQFNAASLDCVPLHEDDREFTPEEVAADLVKRVKERQEAENPPLAAAAAVAPEPSPLPVTSTSSPSSPNGSGSGRGSGRSSRGGTSASSRAISTRKLLPVPGTPHDAAPVLTEGFGKDGVDGASGAVGVVG